jgi:mannosyl-oligosaccharide glucosidase
LKSKAFDDEMISNAKSIFSDVLGGIGYFYGDSVVDIAPYELDESSEGDKNEEIDELEALLNFGKEYQAPSSQNDVQPDIIHTEPMHLFSATPSRPFFPRGFFWDEGFHQTIIAPFDSGLMLQMVTSWFNLMDKNGWIAREQILGEEARVRVPEQFQVQYPHYANPPTLVIPLAFLANRMSILKEQVVFQNNDEILFTGGSQNLGDRDRNAGKEALKKTQLKSLYRNLKKNFEWYQKTQISKTIKDTALFRWRGRTDSHCLPSGLDDYPRQGPVSENDIHMDLLSWVGFYAKTLQEIATLLNYHVDSKKFEEIVRDVKNNLIKYHWSEEEGLFCDAVIKNGKIEHFCHAGYLSLFPFVHGLVDTNSVQVKSFLDLISDPKRLWTDYGLRSLSQQDEFYGKGENYWRGPIWVNINYLVLRSLKKYYMVEECEHKAQASEIYKNLRDNLIKNIMSEYQRTSFVWEQYDQNDGKGKRSHPFTGWSALIVNIMAEIY